MIKNQITSVALGTLLVLLGGIPSPAMAETPCKPYEVVPGVKQLPAGCKPGLAPRRPLPADRQESGSRRGFKIGETEVHIGGRVRAEYGFRR